NEQWDHKAMKETKQNQKEKEIRDIKKTTTNTLWFRNLSATKLKEGTTVYAEDMDDPREDAPFNITIEEDGEVVFYEKVKKDEEMEDREEAENDAKVQEDMNKKGKKIDKKKKKNKEILKKKKKKDEKIEDRDQEKNDAKVQKYINEKVQKIDKGIEVTKANVINEQINIDVSTDYDEDIQDDEDRRAITYTGFAKGIDVSNMLGQIFYMSDEYEWETLNINMDNLGYVEVNRQLYVGMDDKLKDAVTSKKDFIPIFL